MFVGFPVETPCGEERRRRMAMMMMLESVAFCRSLAPKAGLPGTSSLRGVPSSASGRRHPLAALRRLRPAPPENAMKSRQSRTSTSNGNNFGEGWRGNFFFLVHTWLLISVTFQPWGEEGKSGQMLLTRYRSAQTHPLGYLNDNYLLRVICCC